MQVIVYTTNTSSYSETLKKYLESLGVAFIEKMIDQNDGAKKEMISFTQGYLGTPFTVIKKDDNTFETVVGFDKGKIQKILDK